MIRLAVALCALGLAGCASSRLPAETPDGAALDVATLVRQTAADVAGAVAGGATPQRRESLWGDALEAADEARRVVPSSSAAKPAVIAAAQATTAAAQALALSGAEAARPALRQAQARLGRVADALARRLPRRAPAIERLREPLA